jgi:protein tyrosine/serine phosphatase
MPMIGLASVFIFTANAFDERAERYNELYEISGSSSSLKKLVSTPAAKTRQFRTVLPGVLYRGGGPGGQKPLPAEALQSLCEQGFSLAIYGYTDGYKNPGTIKCTNKLTGASNELEYIAGDIPSLDFKLESLKEIKEVIEEKSKGPVFVHCWNGHHSSGELAAIALRQFCSWSGSKALDYWLGLANGFPKISRIEKYVPSQSLEISEDDKEDICPKE